MATCSVTGTVVDGSGTGVSTATIRFRVTRPVLDASSNLVLPTEISTTSSALGAWTLAIDQGISGILSIDYPASSISATQRSAYSIAVPLTASATFASLYPTEV